MEVASYSGRRCVTKIVSTNFVFLSGPQLRYSSTPLLLYPYDTLASLLDSGFRVGRSGPVASDGPGFEHYAAPGG